MSVALQNNVVARFRDGNIIKGITYDFGPGKKTFHVVTTDGNGKKIHEVATMDLKALFFVKTLEGDRNHAPSAGEADKADKTTGTVLLRITFLDGEVLVGTTNGYAPEREGFFVIPARKDSNNLRAYVISSAVKNVETL